MPNKKTIRRNKRNSKRSRSRKGGFFGLFDDKHNTGNESCNPNNLANLKSSIDKVDALSTLAKLKSEETNESLHKLLDRINKMEPHFDDTIKELAYSIEGTESSTKSMHPIVMSLKRDTNSLQEEINVVLGRVEKLNTLANQNSHTERNMFEKEVNSKISNLERQVPDLKYQLSDLKTVLFK